MAPHQEGASLPLAYVDIYKKIGDNELCKFYTAYKIRGEESMKDNELYCFACGTENPIGLKLEFSEQDGKCISRKIVPKEFEGYDGIVHGGILTTMLDEVMVQCIRRIKGEHAVTARIDVRYRQPTPVGELLTITGWEEARKHNFIHMKGTIALPDGTVTAEASAQMAIAED